MGRPTTKILILLSSVILLVSTAIGSYVLLSRPSSGSIPSWTAKDGGEDRSSHWSKKKIFKRRSGVALVIHGLNLRPDRMMSIISGLNDLGIDVLNVSLRGHGDNYAGNVNVSTDEARLESFRKVTYALWRQEVYEAYGKARKRASKKKVPLLFVGYSLGGLMCCDLILSQPDVQYDRMVLFAPALNVTAESYLLKALMPFPNIVIDSLAPLSYRANEGTPMAAYKALFEAIAYFGQNISGRLNKPTVLFIDEKDEFISRSKLTEMIAQNKLDQWQIHVIEKDPDLQEICSYHLIIDQASMGNNAWRRIKGVLAEHVKARR